MKAIVLTCDKYRTLTDHMIFKYQQLWPEHPFVFRVPYQEIAPTLVKKNVEYIKTRQEIRATVLSLLEDLDDEEMIFWCIDDKYPISLNVTRIEQIHNWLVAGNPSLVSGVLFCRCRNMWNRNRLTGEVVKDDKNREYLGRTGYQQIWIHQFLRVKVLRHLFECFPENIPAARLMDQLKHKLIKPSSHQIFVSRRNLAVYGESTLHGVLTSNCYKSIQKNRLPLPEWHSGLTAKKEVMGTVVSEVKRRVWKLRRRLSL